MTTDLAAAGTAAPGFRLAPELTIGSIWFSASGRAVDDDLLRWPPDLSALTDVALDRPAGHRLACGRCADNGRGLVWRAAVAPRRPRGPCGR